MRWVVEVSSIGKTDLQKFVVEAESWQRALQAARAQRGEDGPMSGFSIELLDEGYRAVDPLARVRFVVKRAPDDVPLTAPPPKDAKASVAPTQAAEATKTSTPPAAPSSSSTVTKSSPPRPAVAADKGSNGPASKKADEAPASKQAPPAIGSQLPGLPAIKVLSSREQDPTDASPLTYREYSFAVPSGTSESVAADVLRQQLKLVDAHLFAAKMGKLVNLAVFDVEFTGKPPAPPIATLSWKDWKGEPVLGYPRRGAAEKQVKPPTGSGSTPPPSGPQTSGPQSVGPLFPPPSMPPANLGATAPAAPVPAIVNVAPPPPSTAPMVAQAARLQAPAPQAPAPQAPPQAPAPQAPTMSPASIPPPAAAPAHASVAPPAPVHASVPPPAPAHASVPPAPVHASVPPPAPAHASVPPPAFPAAGSIPPPAHVAGSVPPPAPAAGGSVPPPAGTGSVPPPAVRTPSGRFVRGRTTGDELISALFESMHDLHFLRDALDGGQFCLALATEMLPARAAFIHFFDIDKREWVIACTRGKDTTRLLTLRSPEGDEHLRQAAKNRRAIVTTNAATSAQRYEPLGGGTKSMIIAPIMQAGRALGAIEIVNPLDGMPFNEDEGNAMTYIAEQYAEYLGSRGIVLDRDRIQKAAAAR